MRLKTKTVAVVVMVVCGFSGGIFATTLPSSISRSPLAIGSVSERLSIGVGYERIKRDVDFQVGPDRVFEADRISGYVGFDVLPWLTLYVTAGSTEFKDDSGIKTAAGLSVCGGVSAYLWESDVLTPAFIAGRLSIKAMAEASRSRSDYDGSEEEWTEAMAALPIGYEIFDRYPTGASGIQTSLALYAGPAVSSMSGTVKNADNDFDAKKQVGFVAGLDIYLAPQFSVGADITVFDEVSYGASAAFHF